MPYAHRMNQMERKMLSEVYRRLVIERARARATNNEDMVRILTEEIIDLEVQLGGSRAVISILDNNN